MPALAPRFTGDTTELRESVGIRLAAEFLTVPAAAVERCVADVWARAEHLGVGVSPSLVERIAREHLLGMVKSTPPSGPPG